MAQNELRRRTVLGAGLAGVLASLPWPSSASTVDWTTLRLTGDLVLPGDAAYATAKQLDSGYFDSVDPAAVAYCANAQDISTCLLFAQDNGITAAVRSGGHSAAGYSTTTGLVVDVSRLDSVSVGASTVSLGPGAQSVDAVAAVAPRGMALVTGNGATVCAGGFLQAVGSVCRTGSSASRATGWSPPTSCSPAAGSCTARRRASRTCSGRCGAVVAATSVW